MSIASLDTENIWFSEIISSLFQLLTKTSATFSDFVAAILNNAIEKMYWFFHCIS